MVLATIISKIEAETLMLGSAIQFL
jgi:hypothetical protein